MTLRQLQISPFARTYVDEARLNRALADNGLARLRHLVVWTKDGRCTAIFPLSSNEDNAAAIAQRGFMVIS